MVVQRRMGFEDLNKWLISLDITPQDIDIRPSNTTSLKLKDFGDLPAGPHCSQVPSRAPSGASWRVYMGDYQVIHFGPSGIIKEDLDDFISQTVVVYSVQYENDDSEQLCKTAAAAEKALSNEPELPVYNFLSKNCDAFVISCRTGRWDMLELSRAVCATRQLRPHFRHL